MRGEVCFASEKAIDSDPMSLRALTESVCDQKLAGSLGAETIQCVLGGPHNVGDLKTKSKYVIWKSQMRVALAVPQHLSEPPQWSDSLSC